MLVGGLLLAGGTATATAGQAPIPARLELPAIDRGALLASDGKRSTQGPLQFAAPIEVLATPATAGSWQPGSNGTWSWLLELHVPGATDLSLVLEDIALPAGSELSLRTYSGDAVDLISSREAEKTDKVWTQAVPGDRVVVQLAVPVEAIPNVGLTVTRVNAGYRDLFRILDEKQGSCNVDVACSEGDPWRNQIASVGLYSVDGCFLCTGTLLADLPRSFRSFFLTASHCGVTQANAASVVVYWGFDSPSCGQRGGG